MLKKLFYWIIRKIQFGTQICSTMCTIILNDSSVPRRIILWEYLKFQCKHVILEWLLKRKIRKESFLGFRVVIQEYWIFCFIFKEIFVEQCYRFKADRPDPLIIDCGSNFGMSILYFKKIYPASRIIAFEPSRSIAALLEQNISLNQLGNITLHKKAVSQKDETLNFYYEHDQMGTIFKDRQGAAMAFRAPEVVEAVRLSPYITEEVDFLKIDIEGAEEGVFLELAESRKLGMIKELVFEYHHHLSPNEDRLSNILSLLEREGFGYQIQSNIPALPKARECQDIVIYAYRKVRTV